MEFAPANAHDLADEEKTMVETVSDVAFTPAVKAMQERFGSRAAYAKRDRNRGWQNIVTPELAGFIAERDSFYLATASAAGQPYIQHRGGPAGFLKVLDERTFAFADFRGNKQYITIGNLSENDKAYLFLMDYARQARVKIWGRARIVEDAALLERLSTPGYAAKVERAIVFEITAWDANCRQHITRRFNEAELLPAFQRMQARIDELEAEVTRLKAQSSTNS